MLSFVSARYNGSVAFLVLTSVLIAIVIVGVVIIITKTRLHIPQALL